MSNSNQYGVLFELVNLVFNATSNYISNILEKFIGVVEEGGRKP